MKHKHILIIEDDEDILSVLRHIFTTENFQVSSKNNGIDGIEAAKKTDPDLVLLDINLPGKDGYSICRELKALPDKKAIPIIMLTARESEDDIVRGLEAGADDYLVKPFRQKELLARIAAILKRHQRDQSPANRVLGFSGLSLDPQKRVVSVDGERVDLTFSEFGILFCLMSNPGWVHTRSQIVNHIRGDSYNVTDRTIDVQVVGLRRKLGPYEKLIETVRGVGYRFAEI